jgi:hypothetical protein
VPALGVGEALRFGRSQLLRNLPWFLAIQAGIVAVWLSIEQLVFASASTPGSAGWIALHLLWFLAMSFPEAALLRLALRLRESGSWRAADLAFVVRHAPGFFLVKMIYLLLVAVGLLFAILPGVYLAVRFAPWGFVSVRGESSPLQVLRKSAMLTRGVRWRLLAFGLLLVVVNAVGLALLGLGILVTLPWTTLAAAAVFDRLRDLEARSSTARAYSGPDAEGTWGQVRF